MDDDYWSLGLATTSRELLGSDHCFDYEEIEDDEVEVVDSKTEYPCPFCLEDFDIVGLYCHIDEEHPAEAESGVCPFCSLRVGMNMVGHMTSKHGDIFNLRCKLKVLSSTLSSSRRDALEGHLQSFLGGSSHVFSSSNMEPDPMLSRFVYNLPTADASESVHPRSLTKPNLMEKSSDESISDRDTQTPSSLSEGQASSSSPVGDRGEKARRSEFVQGIFWSTFLDDDGL